MTNEEKELLLKDLCGRLPYGTICEDVYGNSGILFELTPELKAVTLKISDFGSILTTDIDNVKPYLRPMSNMTEKERAKYLDDALAQPRYSGVDWLNETHFDYRGLIPMGLALEAPENMYH